MTKPNLVRPSRDGDQFHYLWAARRCLKLLHSDSELVAVSIEGSSEGQSTKGANIGEDVIDVAEYYGSEEFEKAVCVHYFQLKHSTLRSQDAWTFSGLEKTLEGFAKRYVALEAIYGSAALIQRLRFSFVTNRPIAPDLIETVADAAARVAPRHPKIHRQLRVSTGLTDASLATFCSLITLEGAQDGYWNQRNLLFQDLAGYLPDADADAPTQLKELVTRKALSESADNPRISKYDVLRALKCDIEDLYPAKCAITDIANAIPREQEVEFATKIVSATTPIVIHADGGVGKSVVATRIGRALPGGSVSVLYDCFGNGQYRNPANYRHRHKDALVQISNELASKGLCHPLIPTAKADTVQYLRAFIYRLHQAITLVRSANPSALLCIIIDAADNAQMEADVSGDPRSFVKDLIRIAVPEGVRLVFLCRTHRQHLLNPPYDTLALELRPFSVQETGAHLKRKFGNATDVDIAEFHRLSSNNPRVQALALSWSESLSQILLLLGPNPTSVENAIASILDKAVAKLKDAPFESNQIDKICAGSAILRPLIPIPVLAAMSGIDAAAVKSFAYDLGRPLLVTGDTIQFRDEPVETWFREKFKPTPKLLQKFISELRPLATKSGYVAASLPQLLLDAGKFSELVSLALTSDELPNSSPLERRNIELQRLQLALKAALRARRHMDAAKLSLKAANETAGDNRRRNAIQSNPDLAGVFLPADTIRDLVLQSAFDSQWSGSHHVYEASILSTQNELVIDARSQLRIAYEWLKNWSVLTEAEKKEEPISDQDIAEIIFANLNIAGPGVAAKELHRWKPRDVSYRVGRLLVRRMIDHGRYSEVDALTVEAVALKDLHLVLAAIVELREIGRSLPKKVIAWATSEFAKKQEEFKGHDDEWSVHEHALIAPTALLEKALEYKVVSRKDASATLATFLPSDPPITLAAKFNNSRFALLRGYCLQAALNGHALKIVDLAHKDLKAEFAKANPNSLSNAAREFQVAVGALLPWHEIWASAAVGKLDTQKLHDAIEKALRLSAEAARHRYEDEDRTADEIALVWMEILHKCKLATKENIAVFDRWKASLRYPLFTPTLNALCRLCGQNSATMSEALAYSLESYKLSKEERSEADSKAKSYIEVCRAVLPISALDAKAYFDEALEIAGKVGDENLLRWNAVVALAEKATDKDRPSPKVAYEFARCAEFTYDYVNRDKHFDWVGTVKALCGLCPASGISVLSRWRDRGFGSTERILPVAIQFMIESDAVEPNDAVPFVCFSGQWNFEKLLSAALNRCMSHADKERVSHSLYRYAQFSSLSNSSLQHLRTIAANSDIDLPPTNHRSDDRSTRRAASRLSFADTKKRPKARHQWKEIFRNIQLTNTNDIALAFERFKSSDKPWSRDEFFDELIKRVKVGREPTFINALILIPSFDLYDFRMLLERFPSKWKDRPAITASMANVLAEICKRHCLSIEIERHYQTLPFELAGSLSGLSKGEIIDIVLDAISELPDFLGSARLFSLVSLLAIKLNQAQALESLKYGLSLYDNVLEATDGDGPWSSTLVPPKNIRACLAGYIRSALAAPEATSRWEAAHAVVALCRLKRKETLSELIKQTNAKISAPFTDAKLPFYELHAFQWLLIGLARASIETPQALAPFGQQIVNWAMQSEHVLIRGFAARAALQLISAGLLSNAKDVAAKLAAINKSPFPFIKSKYYERSKDRKEKKSTAAKEDRYFFGIDIDSYWYEPLGQVFALSKSDIESEALKVIRKKLGFAGKAAWEDDERSRRKLYPSGQTYHSHGSYPRTDDLNFYYSYHAMMIVAGTFLGTVPVHYDRDEDEADEFIGWLKRHDLTRRDGRWLFDRRDPSPFKKAKWTDDGAQSEARRDVRTEDFWEALHHSNMFNLWGNWIEKDSVLEQSTHITSALVVKDKADALLRALSSAKSAYDYAIPSYGNSAEIDERGFELKGWVSDLSHDGRIDALDHWGGSIAYPPPYPAKFIIQQMNLTTDEDLRYWRDDSQAIALMSHVWGDFEKKDRYESDNSNRGEVLQVTKEFLKAMLSHTHYEMIVKIMLHRRGRSNRYSGNEDKQMKPIARYFLIGKNGKARSI